MLARIDGSEHARRMVYDPRFIVTFADRLYAQANRVIALVTLLGSIVGVAGGFAVDNVLSSRPSGGGSAIGVILGTVIGFMIGSDRAFHFKLEAQRALCALQTEINTRPLAYMNQWPQQQPHGPPQGAPPQGAPPQGQGHYRR
jgi:hypothetical protein